MKKPFKKIILPFLTALFLFSCGSKPFDINKEGGIAFTLECDPLQFLLSESLHTSEQGFLKALEATVAAKAPRNKVFFDVFLEKYEALNPGRKLAPVFMVANHQKYTLDMTNAQVKEKLFQAYADAVTRTQVVLEARLENFGIPESERKVYKNQQNQVMVEVAKNYPLPRLRNLLQSTAEMGFFETYENTETFNYLMKLNSELANEMANDSSDQSDADSLRKKHPLMSALKLNIHQEGSGYEMEKGCRIGYADLKDTARINQLLRSETARLLLPHDMYLVWAARPENPQGAGDILFLHALKTKSIFYPALSGDVIVDARADKDPQMGRPVVSVSMNNEGAKEWEEMTEKNMKHAIAIVMDGYVYSAPIVEGKIPNGQSTISGNFTVEETQDLANVLKASRLPGRTRIIEEKVTEPKK